MPNAWYEIDNVDSIPSPTVLVYPDRVRENLCRMIAWSGDVGRLRPHVKTHKLPQILAMKLELGITKFKTSTIAEAEMCAIAGCPDVLLAYQPVGPNIARLIQLIKKYPATRFAAILDTPETIQEINAQASVAGVQVDLLIDINVGMNRTGIVAGDSAIALYRQLDALPAVRAAGLHAYDGHLHQPELCDLGVAADAAFAAVWEMKRRLEALHLAVPIVVASGTPTSSLMVRHPSVEVSAGTTVLWDFGQETLTPHLNFLNAAVLLTRVISRPTSETLCLDLGHKAVASEMPQPRVRFFGLEDATVVMQSEEHLVLKSERASDYPVGTVVYGIPRHVCPTIALHLEVWAVRDRVAAETWTVTGRSRKLTI